MKECLTQLAKEYRKEYLNKQVSQEKDKKEPFGVQKIAQGSPFSNLRTQSFSSKSKPELQINPSIIQRGNSMNLGRDSSLTRGEV